MPTKRTQKDQQRQAPAGSPRRLNQLRPVTIEVDFIPSASGSCLVSFGQTRVICTASFSRGVPEWLAGRGQGWVTAEYGMLPASTPGRKPRKPDGRGTEIQRIIGRVLRSVVDMNRLGENTIFLDCDVIGADGGTRTASITGAYVALARAVRSAQARGLVGAKVLTGGVSAVSVGLIDGKCTLDLEYSQDVRAEVDMNVAITHAGQYVEVQASGEHGTFSDRQLGQLLALARKGCRELAYLQRKAILIQGNCLGSAVTR